MQSLVATLADQTATVDEHSETRSKNLLQKAPISSPLKRSASTMSVLQPSHSTTASPAAWKTSLLSIVTPALCICFDLAYSIQYLLTAIVSFLLAHGLYAAKVLAVNSYHASRIFLINAWRTLAFLAVKLFYASEIIIINAFMVSKVVTTKTAQNSSALLAHGMVAASFAVKNIWKRTEKARARIFFEFMVWLLHPSPVVLLIFWPGWIFVIMGVCYYNSC